jgi:hypothetical protein
MMPKAARSGAQGSREGQPPLAEINN